MQKTSDQDSEWSTEASSAEVSLQGAAAGDESTLKHDSTIRKMNGVENVNGNSASIKLPISKEKPIIALENKTALNGEVDSFYEENSHKTPNKSKRRARSSVQTPENVLRERNAAFQRNYAKDVTRGEVEDMNEETLPVPRRISNSIQLGQKGAEENLLQENANNIERQGGLAMNLGHSGADGSFSGDGEDSTEINSVLSLKDRIGADEYTPLDDVLASAERAFGIVTPLPVPTFRERMRENRTDSRFMVVNLILENFKSYAGRVAIGPFHRSFTCIIGPNGSGKSNTIDAMLFVFGYKTRRLRAAKITELIHKSDQFPECGFCRVTVHFARVVFDAADTFSQTEVAGSRYSISREVRKNGKDTYTINGIACDRGKVTDQLRKDGIDLDHNRFLILQGEVEQIAMMKPKGKNEKDEEMLEYIEDIVGTNQYKEPILLMNAKVEELVEAEDKQNMEVCQFSKLLLGMEAVRKQTEDFLLLENEVMLLKHMRLQVQKMTVTKAEEELSETSKEIDVMLKIAESGHAAAAAELVDLSAECARLRDAIKQLQQNPSVTGRTVSDAESDVQKLQTKLSVLKKALTKTAAEENKLATELEKLENAPERLQVEIEQLDRDITKFKASAEEARVEFQEALAKLPDKLKNRHIRQDELHKDLDDLRPSRDRRLRELDDKKIERNAFTDPYDRAVARGRALEIQLARLEANVTEAETEIIRIKANLSETITQVADKERTKTANQQQLELINGAVREKREMLELARVQSQIITNDRILKRLLAAQREKILIGIVGRLGDLATIDEKYDVAVSTNFGQLDYIVVENPDVAKAVINFARLYNLGYTRTMALDQITNTIGNIDRHFITPADSVRLFDLMNISDDRYRPLFYYVVRNDLVTDDLDGAKVIAFGEEKHKVVTLDGKSVDGRSGCYVGGGNAVRGKMRTNAQGINLHTSYNGPPLETLQTECRDLENQAQDLLALLTSDDVTINDLKEAVRDGQLAVTHLEARVKADKNEREKAMQSLDKQRKVVHNLTPDPARDAEFRQEIEALTSEFNKVDSKYRQVEEQLNAVNQEIARVTAEETDPFKKKEDLAKSALNKQEKSKREKLAKIHSHERDVERTAQNLHKRKEEAKKKADEITVLEEELANSCVKIHEAMRERDENRQLLENKKNEERKINIQVDEKEKACETEKRKVDSCRVAKEKHEKEIGRVIKEKQKLEKAMGEINLNEVHSDDPRAKLELKMVTSQELEKVKDETIEAEIHKVTVKMGLLKPDIGRLKEYYDVDDKRKKLMERVEEVRKKRKLAYTYFMALKNRRYSEFIGALRVIQSILKTTYRQLTLGGDASLEPIDRFDPFAEGLEFMVKPKTKSWKNIGYLSGGEKTISSLALIFALHYFKPTPFYIMDEIDAALDFRNTSVIAFFVKERAVSAQFIIVSLRNQMFETAYRLVGICKPNNRSMTMYIDPMKHVALAEDEKRRTDGRPTGSLFSQETQPPRETGGTTLSQVPRPTVGSSFSQPTQTPRESHRGA